MPDDIFQPQTTAEREDWRLRDLAVAALEDVSDE